MTVAGLIFSNMHDQSIPEMTRMRTMASIPYGCRYRLIDFALSNMVNSGITNVGVITHYNYQSLMDHIGTGKDWDMARRSGGIKILPPYITAYENSVAGKLYSNRLEALIGSANFIHRCGADYIVLSDSDVVVNVDLTKVIRAHLESEAYLTLVTKAINVERDLPNPTLKTVTYGEDLRIDSIADCKNATGDVHASTNIMVIKRSDLQAVLADAMAFGYDNFFRDVIAKQLDTRKICAYPIDTWCSGVDSLESYFKSSMALLDADVRRDLFGQSGRRIYTKIRNSAPTKYTEGATVKNSLVADGCVIEGTVENSILFRGVRVGRGTVVKNCILLQDTFVGANATLNCVISDKNVVIKDGRMLSGHETMPFFIGKDVTV